jgi:Neuraminidase-like domain/Salmonella virulence plasmid 28.1kDa A protein
MTLHVIDVKTLGLAPANLEIESIAVNSTASWVYLGRGFSIDLTTPKLIACHMDTATGKAIEAPIFLPDLPAPNNSEFSIRISQISVDESKRLLYLSRVISGILKTPKELEEFEAITVYKLDETGRPTQIVKTCRMQVPDPQKGPNDDGIYSFEIHQNYLYAVGQRTNGILIYKLDDAGIPTTNPIAFFPTTACQQIKILNDKIYLGTIDYLPDLTYFTALKVGILSPNPEGIPIPTNLQSFSLSDVSTKQYLDFQISNRGIFPQISRYITNIDRVVKRPLFFLPFNGDGFPVLPLQTIAPEIRALGVNSKNELWFAADDKYQDAIDGSEDSRGIKIQKHDSNESFVEKLKFARLVTVAENGTPVLLCDDVRAGEVLGEKSTISGWQIRFKVNVALPRLNPAKTFVLEGSPAQGAAVAIAITPGEWSDPIDLNPFLRSTRQPIAMRFGHKQFGSDYRLLQPELSELEVEIEIFEGLPANGGINKALLPQKVPGDLVAFMLPGYGVYDLPDGDSPLIQRFDAKLIQWASEQVLPVARFTIGSQGIISGTVRQANQTPFKNGIIRAFHVSEAGDIRLGEDTTDAEGHYTIRYTPLPTTSVINLRVSVSDGALNILKSSEIVRAANPIEVINLEGISSVIPIEFQVTGKVSSLVSTSISGLIVQVVDKTVGKDDVVLGQTLTEAEGNYKVVFTDATWLSQGKAQPDLQTRILVGDRFLAASEVRYNASRSEILNVSLAESSTPSLRSEHETLLQNIASHFTGNLNDLQETDTRQDITYLANKTGWDARAVAIASLSEQFSQTSQIDPALYYTLFRAGLPANENAIYQIDPKTAESTWRQGIEQGIIPATLEAQIPQSVARLKVLAAERSLAAPALVGVSSLKEMLTVSLGQDNNPAVLQQHEKFAELYIQHQDNLPEFWSAAEANFGESITNRLKLDGKLGYLTINNVPLIQSIYQDIGANGISDPLNLIENGYYRTDKWQTLLAGGIAVPAEIPGKDEPEKRSNYAEFMSAQMRLSYPTAVVAQMVLNDETQLTDVANKAPIHSLLMAQHGNFEIGMQPFEQFVLQNNLQVEPQLVQEIARIQRVHQITPTDGTMNALLSNNLDSAYSIVQYTQADFVNRFQTELGGENNTILIHNKAQEVHDTVLNIAVSYLTARNGISIGGNLESLIINSLPAPPAANASNIIAYPTLEKLFGEMDYCTCEHCRSILSPAAYLVNLLQFCDKDPANLPNPQPVGLQNPQTVLFERRPDIQHLPLTCENTNTPLPYIDIVNETLEFFVTHNLNLTSYQGYDTNGDATAEELSASPQFDRLKDEISDRAYQTLAGKSRAVGDPLPLLSPTTPLPFHQPLEHLRRYFERLEAPLPKVMEVLRKNESLDRANQNDYGWRDILMEELRISRSEYALLTDRTQTLQQVYGYPRTIATEDILGRKVFEIGLNFIPELDLGTISPGLSQLFIDNGKTLSTRKAVRVKKAGDNWTIVDDFTFDLRKEGQKISVYIIGLANAKKFARRVGISYQEVIDILQTRFVNPNSVLITKLERLGVAFLTLKQFKDGTISDVDFDKLLPDKLDLTQYGGDVKAWVKNDDNYARIMSLIALTNPNAVGDPCSFDRLEFRYTNPDRNTNQIRPFEFIRLIRFIRLWKKLGWTIDQTDKAIAALYPPDQILNAPDDATNLLRLDTGFLTLLPRLGVLKQVMDRLKLKPQKDLQPLLACFAPIDTFGGMSLYHQMFLSPSLLKQDRVFAEDGFGNYLVQNPQKIAAHTEALRAALQLTDDELLQILTALGYGENTILTLDTLSAIFRHSWLARKLKLSVREFLALKKFTELDPFATPEPVHPPIQLFIEMVKRLRSLALKPVQALYLIWNQDLSGKSVPSNNEILGFASSLRTALTAIESEYIFTVDSDGQIARSKMALVYGDRATDLFFGLLGNTLVSTVSHSHTTANLEAAILNVAPGRLAYDDFRKQLSFTGVLTPIVKDALKAIVGVSLEFQQAIDKLYDENQKVIKPFFAQYPQLLPLYEAYITSNEPVEKKRSDLLANFLPELKLRRKQQQVLQSISAATKIEPEFVNALLDNATVLHAIAELTQPALIDLTAIETPGLSAQFFFRNVATGVVDLVPPAQANLSYSPDPQKRNPLPVNPAASPDNNISGIWQGYLAAPENGLYNIAIDADAGAIVSLKLEGKSIALTPNANVWRNAEPIDLRAGTLYAIVLTVEKVKNTLAVRWQTAQKGWEVIPAAYLYPNTSIEQLRMTYIRFLKTANLAIALKLTPNEIAYLAAIVDYQIAGAGWFNSIPVTGDPDRAKSTGLRNAFNGLLNFAQLKSELSPDEELFLTLLKDPSAAAALQPNKRPEDSLLYRLTRWEPKSLAALLTHFGLTIANLNNIPTFQRVFDAYKPIELLKIPASALLAATTNEPSGSIVRNLQSALRARYDESDWLKVLKPINDEMRGLQRDALVAYILHQMRINPITAHIDTPDKLFEYFLMDVQMEPCMQTSRIRHALSSVQLFIDRCLMNLETTVSPASIDAKQWSWMKRYRVWEANRKVFLYPENWLEPELRDDQSPFFKETMSELLQGDITEDRAAVALLNYLSKLEEVAKLEPCGIHFVENDLSKLEDDVAHVVARTAGANRKYFYRRRDSSGWTPWEQIKVRFVVSESRYPVRK